VVVLDQPSENICSVVAAGLFNPITGKFLKKSWVAEKLFPFLFDFYKEAEKNLGEKFFFETPIYRPFESIEEQNDWMTRSENPVIKDFIREIYTRPAWPHQVHNPFGGLLINQSGYLGVNSFLNSVRNYLKSRNEFQEGYFQFSKLEFSPSEVTYPGIESKYIVFCDGARINQNPFFGWVPVRPMKGEVLVIEMQEPPEVIFNRGAYVVPSEGKKYNVGATYQQPPFESGVSEQGRLELLDKLSSLLVMPYNAVGHKWGVRPTSPDRKPIFGPHPEHKNLFMFNGLGTKGVSLAPFFTNQMAGWLNGEYEIMSEVNIQRFYPLYSRSS
jgi:hypothetical protein